MAVNLSALAGAGQQFLDNDGNPLSGGKLWSYEAGTTTPQTTYTDAAGAVAHANPIILDASGRVAIGEIWLTAGNNYKFILTTSSDVLLATWDNITGINGTGITSNAVTVVYDPEGTGAVATTVQAKLRETVSVKDFGAVGDGVTDDTVAIQAALTYQASQALSTTNALGNYLGNAPDVFFPQGQYVISSTLNMTTSYGRVYGQQAIITKAGSFTGTIALQNAGNAWRIKIEGLQFEDFDKAIYLDSSNKNSGLVQIIDCGFFGHETAIHLDCKSTQNLIERCMFRSNVHELYVESGDYVLLKDSWISRGLLVNDYDAGCVVDSGHLTWQHVLGVPRIQTVLEPAWVRVNGSASFVATNECRFGGEAGSHCAVNANNQFIIGSGSPKNIIIRDSSFFSSSGDRAMVRLFTLPNQIIINDNRGFANSPYVVWSSTVDAGTQAALVANVTEARLSDGIFNFNYANNSKFSTTITSPEIPDNLLFGEWENKTRQYIVGGETNPPTVEMRVSQSNVSTGAKIGIYNFYSGDASGSGPGVAAYIAGVQNNTNPSQGALVFGAGQVGSSTADVQDRIYMDYLGNLYPIEDDARRLGGPSNLWSEVFAGNGTINTSDARQKQQDRSLTSAEKAVAVKIKGLIKAFKFNNAVDRKGDDARIHFGVYAQEAEQAFKSEGLDAHQYGLFCYDEWYEIDGKTAVPNELGEYPAEAVKKDKYGIRYDQLLAFVISAL